VVREDDVGRQVLAHGRGVRFDVALALRSRQLLEEPRLETLVAVDDEHGEQPLRQLRPHHARAPEIEQLRPRLLAEDGDVISRARPFPRERLRVDVRAGPGEEVPVPEEDPHRRQ
jgi:hypothetical protein